jgi:hypothetical protein
MGILALAVVGIGGMHIVMLRFQRTDRRGSGSGEAHRVRINPFARTGLASRRRTLQTQSSSSATRLEHEDSPSRDRLMTAWASPLVVEGMPEAKFVKAAKGIDLIVLRKGQWRRRRHGWTITKRSGIDNRSGNWRAYRLNSDLKRVGCRGECLQPQFQQLWIGTPAATSSRV